MVSKEYLEERVKSFTDKIQKKQDLIAKKLGWIEKKQRELRALTDSSEIYWKQREIYSLEEDIRYAKRDMEDYKASLNRYQAQLDLENSKKRDIPAIVEFLNKWKELAYNFIISERDSKERAEEQEQIQEMYKSAWYEYDEKHNYEKYNQLYREYVEAKRAYESKYSDVLRIISLAKTRRTSFEEELNKELEEEWKNKYDDLVLRVSKEVGNIKDASNLRVSPKGNLDGIVVGDKGKARVWTVGAGGYNIQVYHHRVLVHKISD